MTLAPLTLQDLITLTGGQAHALTAADLGRPIATVTTDSRSLQPGEVFLALRGETFDGHRFAAAAIQAGAIAVIVDTPVKSPSDAPLPQVIVGNSLAAYQAIGRAWRERSGAAIVAVTGSVGKTTMKELIAAVLGTAGPVHKTEANFNNEVGVPKTLLQLQEAHRFAIVEMGMRGRGQIAELARCARPDVAVITNVGTAHIGLLGSEQAIAEAKCELLAELPSGAIAVLNGEDDRLLATAATVWRGQTLTYGLDAGELRGELIEGNGLRVDGMTLPLPLPGRHNALNYLGALAVAKVLGVSWEPLLAGLAVVLPEGRAQCHRLPQDVQILDETYNAGLESMRAALHLLAATEGQRRLAVLGTMKELGDRAAEFHQQIGQLAAEYHQAGRLDGLFVLCDDPTAGAIVEGAGPALRAESFASGEELRARLAAAVQPGDRWLFKASHSVGLDRFVREMIAQYGPAIATSA